MTINPEQTPSPTPDARLMKRRRLIQRLAAYSGVLSIHVVVGILAPKEPETASPKVEITPLKTEDLTINGKSLRVLLTEHTSEDWPPKAADITREIKRAKVVIPEYLPSEYASLRQHPNFIESMSLPDYDEANGLFNQVETVCRKEGKEMWVVDPAYNRDCETLRMLLWAPALGTYIGGYVGILEGIMQKRKIPRRELFKMALKIGIGGIGIVSQLLWGMDIENDLRQVVTAEQLHQLYASSAIPQNDGISAAMIIPEGHWTGDKIAPGIRSYLLNDKLRSERLDRYKSLFGETLPSLFTARHYLPGYQAGKPASKHNV